MILAVQDIRRSGRAVRDVYKYSRLAGFSRALPAHSRSWSPKAVKERCPSAAIGRAVKEVAGQLRNTPSVGRKCYIYPLMLDVFGDAKVLAVWNSGEHRLKRASGLSSEEATLLQFLEQRKH